ncbi:MAG: TetR/AcrR family transcriptional regulator [Gammaproteobacteria bacterium]|nr:TetR/AcrR family transcriptional regulator [Gammaproteobacteria bacterium]
MENKTTDKNIDDTRLDIVEAAENRFQTYGYNKTTMVEIASDIGMSAANLYRYYQNKQDIAAACAERCLNTKLELMRNVVHRSDINAAEKLHACVQEMLRYTWETAHETPKLNELVNVVVNERSEIVHQKMLQCAALIAEILQQGNDSGEFAVEDTAQTAETVLASIKMFHVPLFMGLFELHVLQQKAQDVVTLLIKGLARP